MSDRQELDLKYRPRRFADVLGNEGVRQLLLTRSKNGSLGGRSMMFGGPKGTGKTSMARVVAMALCCNDLEDGEPCGKCDMCLAVLSNSHPNVQEFDAASEGTVEKVRSMVKESDYGSFEGGKCIYILDEAQRLSAPAQDALLKSVEDRDFIVILCTTDPDKVRAPIRSRVEEYPVNSPPEPAVISWLARVCSLESIQHDEEALKIIAKNHGNCPRACILALDSISVEGPVVASSVKKYLRFDDLEALTRVLATLDVSPAAAMTCLDDLASRQGPSWIRDNMVRAITSAMRVEVGARPNFPVPTGKFFESRMMGWSTVARELSRVERPILSDIEAILLGSLASSTAPRVVSTQVIVPSTVPPVIQTELREKVDAPVQVQSETKAPVVSPPQPTISEKPPTPASPAPNASPSVIVNKPIEVDGIRFTPDERLTTLDDKIERGSSPPAPLSHGTNMPVQFDRNNVPISEQEFVRSLLNRGQSS